MCLHITLTCEHAYTDGRVLRSSNQLVTLPQEHVHTPHAAARVPALITLERRGTRKGLAINVTAPLTIGGIVCLSSPIIH